LIKIIHKLQAEFEAAKHKPSSLGRLRDFSVLTWLVERLFFWLEFLSPAILFIPTRSLLYYRSYQLQEETEKEAYLIERARHRAQRVDVYLLLCIILEIIAALLLFYVSASWFLIVLQIPVSLRILEIIQANINLNIFDRLRYGEANHVTVSLTRNLILSVLGYLELMILFGLLYATLSDRLVGISHWSESFYFSVITQLTIGYGDIRPIGVARFLTAIQGTIGLFFSLLIMGRFVSFIPTIRTVIGDELRKPE